MGTATGMALRGMALVSTALAWSAACGPSRLVPLHVYDAAPRTPADAGTPADGNADARLDQPVTPTDVSEETGSDTPVDQPPSMTTDAAIPPCPNPVFVDGFASKQPGTTGGAGGRTIAVKTYDELVAATALTEKVMIEIATLIQAPPAAAQIRVQSNKTIRGVGPGAGMTGAGFQLSNVSNVIIQNLQLSKAAVADSITLNTANHVWIDHCDLSSDGTSTYDGLVDVAHGSDFVTISWNVFHDHRLTSLVGHSANPSDPLEDPGHLTVTYHHNWWRGTLFYNPKVRFGTAHVVNNFYDYPEANDAKGVVSQLGAQVLVEGNYFKNIKVPMSTKDSESETDPSKEGSILQRENCWDLSGDWIITKTATWTPSPDEYTYVPDPCKIIDQYVPKCAGPMFP